MSFAQQLAVAVKEARYPQLSELSRQVWQAWSTGTLTDTEAQDAAEAIALRRSGGVPSIGPTRNNAPVTFLGARVRRPIIRKRSIERRRRLAASGPLPPAIAAHFTTGQLAVLRIVGDECRLHGSCSLHIDAIAARAGVCRSTVKTAIHRARELRLVTFEERRRRGLPSLTNIIRIISREWKLWLDRGPKVGVKNLTTTATGSYERHEFGAQHTRERGHSRPLFVRNRTLLLS